MTRHYVFVPGIGGFFLRNVDASYSNKIYTPSHREIHFNRFLTNDDGMLANTYMMAENCSFDEAISQITIEVAYIKSSIEKNKSFELGGLGRLSYDSEHHLTLKNSKHFPLDPESYGLEPLHIHRWKDLENSQSSSVANSEVIVIPKYWLQRVAAIVCVLVCLFSNINLSDKSYRIDQAALFDSNILFGNATPNTMTDESWDKQWEEESTETNIDKPILSVNEPIEASVNDAGKTTSNLSNKLYYIIIASCTSMEEAEYFVKKRQKEGFENIGILERDGRFRLYLKSFTDRTTGESYLEEVRTSTPFQKAWLLPVRQESLLSFYLNKLDNDQLPMELSHPHQRTERDQGWINT